MVPRHHLSKLLPSLDLAQRPRRRGSQPDCQQTDNQTCADIKDPDPVGTVGQIGPRLPFKTGEGRVGPKKSDREGISPGGIHVGMPGEVLQDEANQEARADIDREGAD